MKNLTIKNAEEAWEYIEQDLDGLIGDMPGITFEGWPNFSFKVEGERYQSTLTSTMLPSMYELQLAIYRIYAELNNRNVRSLSQQERQELEISFKVQQGSTDVKADLTSAANKLAESIAKMKPLHWVATVTVVAAMFNAPDMYRAYKESGQPTEAEKIQIKQLELQEKLIDRLPVARQAKHEVIEATTQIMRSVQDADKVTLNNTVYSGSEIGEIIKRKPLDKSEKRLDGHYIITGLKVKEDLLRLEVTSIDGANSFTATWVKENFGFEDQDQLAKAISHETPIYLTIFAKVSLGNISAANILGVGNNTKPEVLADNSSL